MDAKTVSLVRMEIPLQHTWTFWMDTYSTGITSSNYEANLKPLYEVKTVQDFWRAYNNTTEPQKLHNRNNIHFMKRDIKPLWEDPANEKGGCFTFRIDKKETAKVWPELLMLLIGEQLDGIIVSGDEVCGLSVGSRWNSDVIQLWNARADLFNEKAITKKIKDTLGSVELQLPYYKPHKEHDAFTKK
ncbi:translation initiation factor eIF 4e-like domain-containing protein [Syncephalis pseudoplumigaleata]|uniref:Translation initiation factor eIF 4e-like domain-containing protein n=1 Tax=Syncephalis pseudoplumigaleata TaxID=1712513 RepID=A0A4P9Z024_9FUNG|nr:translation initiation factor eIF 4e-like domain-containing protein [Syncephalis pseudoplumigaleata]|eukprot:RKP25212.1 translation initiation factor eIF 4e-like domain-containing protein [Syncephalis pseudoplumigaleata]